MSKKTGIKQIKLTIPDAMMELLEREKKKWIYSSVQEMILEAVRDKYVRNKDVKGASNRGRPKKFNPEDFLKRKSVFVKKGGERIDV